MSSIIDSLAKLAEKFSQKYPGEASGVATLDGSSKVVEDPGSAAYTKGGASGIASLDANQNVVESIAAGGSVGLKVKVVEIDDWDMTALASITVAHGLTLADIRSVVLMVRNDANDTHYSNTGATSSSGVLQLWVASISVANVGLTRLNSGIFDNTFFDSTSYNRGWIIIMYEAP